MTSKRPDLTPARRRDAPTPAAKSDAQALAAFLAAARRRRRGPRAGAGG